MFKQNAYISIIKNTFLILANIQFYLLRSLQKSLHFFIENYKTLAIGFILNKMFLFFYTKREECLM